MLWLANIAIGNHFADENMLQVGASFCCQWKSFDIFAVNTALKITRDELEAGVLGCALHLRVIKIEAWPSLLQLLAKFKRTHLNIHYNQISSK